jgi:hypothetical protein
MFKTPKMWLRRLLPVVPFVILLSACNFPGLRPTQDQFATAAAETVAAQLTLSSNQTSAPDTMTETPTPSGEVTATETPGTQLTVTPSPTGGCTNKAAFDKDVTVPDDTRMDPGESFEKIWRLENVGTCTWTTQYAIVFESGNIMSGPASKPLDSSVPPGGTVDLNVEFTAPLSNGTHRGNWMIRNAGGVLFGLGDEADKPFWVQIVVGPTPTPKPVTVYNFADNYCSASWESGAGSLGCPGTDGDAAGFVLRRPSPQLENGSTENEAALETFPQSVVNGYISGRFPAFDVVEGDRFKVVIGCLYKSGGSACEVKFQLSYRADGGSLQLLDQWTETYDGGIRKINIDLADHGLAGKSVEFSFVVMANGPATEDRAFWLLPRIEGPPR